MSTILHLITQGEFGGAQRYVFDATRGTQDTYDVSVGIGRHSGANDLATRLTAAHIPVMRFHHLRRNIHPYHDLAAIFEIRAYLATHPTNILHLHSSKAGVIGSLAARLLPKQKRPKVVYTVHGFVFLEPLAWWIKKLYLALERITAQYKDAIIVLSKREEKIANEIGFAKHTRVVRIPIGLARQPVLEKTEARAVIASRLPDTPPDLNTRLWVGIIAHFYKTKGHDVLFAALTRISELPPSVVICVGGGGRQELAKHEVRRRGLQNMVFFTDEIPDAGKILPAFDIIVIPSRKEGLPYTLLEALQAGVPVIATDVGGIAEVMMEAKTGAVVPPENSAALAEALTNLLTNDEERKKQAIHTALPQEYRLETFIANLKQLYASL